MSVITRNLLFSGAAVVETLTGDAGGAIAPVAGNITIAGGANLTSTGTPGTITLDLTDTTDHGVQVGNATGSLTSLSVGTDGMVLLGATGADAAFATLTSTGGTVTFTTGANTLNLEVAGGGFVWTDATGATQAMAVDTGYIANRVAGVLAYTLPVTAGVGDTFAIAGSQQGWTIAQNAGQTIHFISVDTTTGIGGSLASTNRYDCVELVCIVANLNFCVRSSTGNITVI